LFLVVGWSAFAGLAVVFILFPLSSWMGTLMIKYEEQKLSRTDARVSIINEMLQGIRIIKYFAWEKHFQNKIDVAREKELVYMIKLFGVYVGYGIIGNGSGILIAFTTFYVYAMLAGNSLDASTAFTAINLLNVVRQSVMHLPASIMQVFKAKVSFDRISSFLNETDIERRLNDRKPEPDSLMLAKSEKPIGFEDAEFVFHSSEESDQFSLRKMTAKLSLGKLTVICGPTGSGKSSLLLALLGEMKLVKGSFFMPKSRTVVSTDPETGFTNNIAYAAQSAWLLNASVRDNILFGEKYDAERYEAVVKGCALAKDFENLEGGDLTEIGEKGINVSGGQKQRISLARACYSRSAVVLLDDPLSAVDAPTARFLLHRCVLGILKGRTVLLVSHATNLVIPFADYVISMKKGEIFNQGTPKEVIRNPLDENLFGINLSRDIFEQEYDDGKDIPVAAVAGDETRLVKDEESAVGSVNFDIYKTYFNATGGLPYVLVFWATFIIVTLFTVGNDWWLKVWTDHNLEFFGPKQSLQSIFSTHLPENSTPVLLPSSWGTAWYKYVPFTSPEINQGVSTLEAGVQDPDTMFYLGVYALFGFGIVFAGALEDLWILLGAVWAGRKMHNNLLHSVLYSPLRFFETTPIGRVLNRFSKDVENIDNNVIAYIQFYAQSCIRALTVVAVIGFISPMFLVFAPFVGVFYIYVAKLYLTTSRELKRLDSVTRSPIYSQFSETLTGVGTVRAYSSEIRFQSRNRERVDSNHKPFFYMWAANRWLCLRTDITSAGVVLVAGFMVVFGGVPAGWAAITITYSLDFTDALLWTVRSHAEMEMGMNAVERVREYTNIEQEPAAIVEDNRPAESWPEHGVIEVKNLSMRYSPELPDVLQNINFQVKPHEKVAVVGRTGAGKSTLSLAFFRIIPMSNGSISIDGMDISKLGLYDLRSRLTIIPQDPVLFNGTLRSNLDPLGENDDEALWEALKRVNFLESIQQHSNESPAEDGASLASQPAILTPNSIGLDFTVNENGSNFSQGQRQLLCLARSLLQRNKIIFLDEATASVDNETDAKIQTAIRREFHNSTIICIAHRLRTVIDYDKILVLDKGQVKEFGTPIELIEDSSVGQFRSMCKETGEFEELVEIARKTQRRLGSD